MYRKNKMTRQKRRWECYLGNLKCLDRGKLFSNSSHMEGGELEIGADPNQWKSFLLSGALLI